VYFEHESRCMTQIFRITHIHNLPFILQHGLYCPNAELQDPAFQPIGFPTLIEYRKERVVPVPPGGTLHDYIPFYFWYRSPMLYVISKGNDPEVIPAAQADVVYIVSSVEALQQSGSQFVFTDRHAKLEYANFYNDPRDLTQLNWECIKTDQWGRQFGPERREMKMAECLVHQHLPREAIIGIAVMNEHAKSLVNSYLSGNQLQIPVKVKPNFYF
jgi:hypothetical protein